MKHQVQNRRLYLVILIALIVALSAIMASNSHAGSIAPSSVRGSQSIGQSIQNNRIQRPQVRQPGASPKPTARIQVSSLRNQGRLSRPVQQRTNAPRQSITRISKRSNQKKVPTITMPGKKAREQKVEVMTPSADGVAKSSGHFYYPDMNEESWIFLPY